MNTEQRGCLMGFFQFLDVFNWLKPARAIGKQAAHAVRRGTPFAQWSFYVPMRQAARAGWSVPHIRDLLRKNGVGLVTVSTLFDEAQVVVDAKDAHYAELLLSLSGVPLKGKGRGAPEG